MGHAYADVTVYCKDSSFSRKLRLLVDTGSTHTWIGNGILKELSVEPLREREFRTVEGRKPKRQIGEALIEVNGQKATTIVVFAEREDESVLGVYALEGLGLELDPTSNRLKKVKAILAV